MVRIFIQKTKKKNRKILRFAQDDNTSVILRSEATKNLTARRKKWD